MSIWDSITPDEDPEKKQRKSAYGNQPSGGVGDKVRGVAGAMGAGGMGAPPMTFTQLQQQGIPRPPPPSYTPTGMLNQGNLEGYLYDMLANPTATPTYQNTMRKVGADIDVDASRRGVFHSTIPVGAYSEAGSNLAAGLQGQAYNQLRGYNQDYEQLMLALLGMS